MNKINKKELYKKYISERKSSRQIAQEYNCEHSTVLYNLRKYNIKSRNHSESLKGKKFTVKHKENMSKSRKGCCLQYLKEFQFKKGEHPSIETEFKSGKNHSQYIEGLVREYPSEFNNELKEKIRKRDDYKCQNCTITEEENIIINGEVLTIHHIDYDKENNSKNNLISLCKQCHSRTNFNRQYWQEYFENKLLISKEKESK